MHWSVSQEKYCGGFSSVDPPLSIPNREVKRTYADGTDRPVGRVGSRRSSDPRTKQFARGSFFVPFRPGAQRRCAAPPGSRPPRLFPSAPGKGQVRAARKMASRYLHSPSARPSPFAAPPPPRRGYLLSQLVAEQTTILFLADRLPRCPGVNGVISRATPFPQIGLLRTSGVNGPRAEITPFTPHVIPWPSAAFLRAWS